MSDENPTPTTRLEAFRAYLRKRWPQWNGDIDATANMCKNAFYAGAAWEKERAEIEALDKAVGVPGGTPLRPEQQKAGWVQFIVRADHPTMLRPDQGFTRDEWQKAEIYAKFLADSGFENVRIHDTDGDPLPEPTGAWPLSTAEYEKAIQQMEEAFRPNKSRFWVLKCLRGRLRENRKD